MRFSFFILLFAFIPFLRVAAQEQSFKQSISVGAEYSNMSSHIILGVSQNRRVTGAEVTLSQRLLHSRWVDWNYDLAISPITMIQDPITTLVVVTDGAAPPDRTPVSFTGPQAAACSSGSGFGLGYTYTETCRTRWTYSGGVSPLGIRFNFAPTHRIQPLIAGNAGFLAATRALPAANATSFNFTFDFGAGVEFFQEAHHAVTAEYRIQHLSNAYRGQSNPGIDSQLVRVSYTFGR